MKTMQEQAEELFPDDLWGRKIWMQGYVAAKRDFMQIDLNSLYKWAKENHYIKHYSQEPLYLKDAKDYSTADLIQAYMKVTFRYCGACASEEMCSNMGECIIETTQI